LLSSSVLAALTTEDAKPGEKTVEVPLSRLRKWQASLKESSDSLRSSEATAKELKSTNATLKKTIGDLENSLSVLKQSKENYFSLAASLTSELETWKALYLELETQSTALQRTSDELLTALKAEKRKRIRDDILAFLGGFASGITTEKIANYAATH